MSAARAGAWAMGLVATRLWKAEREAESKGAGGKGKGKHWRRGSTGE